VEAAVGWGVAAEMVVGCGEVEGKGWEEEGEVVGVKVGDWVGMEVGWEVMAGAAAVAVPAHRHPKGLSCSPRPCE
jgi:hypothetical protein